MNTIRLKRIYELPSKMDGYRILVDRLWPRGVSKGKATIDEWAKDITPSTKIRKEFHHDPPLLMDDFTYKYNFELDNNEHAFEFVNKIRKKLEEDNVTLVYAAKDGKYNHVVILKEWLEKQLIVGEHDS